MPCETFMGFEAGFFTSSDHCRAKIRSVDPSAVKASIESGKVAIVAGFQGTSDLNEITTIGRGGSDTTAVALAAALGPAAAKSIRMSTASSPRIQAFAKMRGSLKIARTKR